MSNLPLIYRTVKGSPLTFVEGDENLQLLYSGSVADLTFDSASNSIVLERYDDSLGINSSVNLSSSAVLLSKTASYVNPLRQIVTITGSLTNGENWLIAYGTGSHAEGAGFASGSTVWNTTSSTALTISPLLSNRNVVFNSVNEVVVLGVNLTSTPLPYLLTGSGTVPMRFFSGSAQIQIRTFQRDLFPYVTIISASYSGSNTTLFLNPGFQSEYYGITGSGTIVSGSYSHAEGLSTTTVGLASHAEGYQSYTSGAFSHAEGQLTTAIGQYSHAEGWRTTSVGLLSHSEGNNTIAYEPDAMVLFPSE